MRAGICVDSATPFVPIQCSPYVASLEIHPKHTIAATSGASQTKRHGRANVRASKLLKFTALAW